MSAKLKSFLVKELQNLEDAGLYQEGYTIESAPQPKIQIGQKSWLNFASDNYLGWANDQRLCNAAKESIEHWGVGWASSPVVSGTNSMHKFLERTLSGFVETEDAMLFPTAYHANMGIFESLFSEQDYLFCDFSIHPSLVDGIRLSPARQFIFKSHDMEDLEDKLKRSPTARFRAIITEGVSTQDGRVAPLNEIVSLAKKYDAIIICDDSHGIGVHGKNGRGTADLHKVSGKIDLITGSFGHAMGGSGGFIAGRRDIINWLRQKSRTYLFSNTLTQATVGAAQKSIELLTEGPKELEKLNANIELFRRSLNERGFKVVPSNHPIVSLVVRDAVVCQNMVTRIMQKGIYALGFCYPVVPRGSARIRFQLSAAHTNDELTDGLQAVVEIGQYLRLI